MPHKTGILNRLRYLGKYKLHFALASKARTTTDFDVVFFQNLIRFGRHASQYTLEFKKRADKDASLDQCCLPVHASEKRTTTQTDINQKRSRACNYGNIYGIKWIDKVKNRKVLHLVDEDTIIFNRVQEREVTE